MRPTPRACAYCGDRSSKLEREHVVSRCLYPASKAGSSTQRLTIPACPTCNRGWADDEAHFRNVLLMAGHSNPAVLELWSGPVARSFRQPDGSRRRRDVAAIMKPVVVNGEQRHMVYPAKDLRILRVVRKIVRGLCFHHDFGAPVEEGRVWVDVMRFEVPPAFLDQMTEEHCEPDVLTYRFAAIYKQTMQTAWLLTFYERTQFIAIVWESEAALQSAEAASASAATEG